jgi:hypothetical protein
MLMPTVVQGSGLDAPAFAQAELMNGPAINELVGASDTTPPTVTVISPAQGTPIDLDTLLVVEVEDETALANVVLYAEYPTLQHAEVVHDGTTFKQPYASQSTRDVLTAGRHYRYNLRRDGGWPGDVNLTAIPVDTGGNISS